MVKKAKEAERDLWQRLLTYRTTGNVAGYHAVRSALVGLYVGLVKDLVTRSAYRLSRRADRGELTSDAYLGLLDAIERFEPGRELKFITFAQQRIRGAIVDGLRSRRAATRQDISRYEGVEAWLERAAQAAGRPVGLNEAALSIGLDPRDVVAWVDHVKSVTGGDRAASLDALVSDGDVKVGDLLPGSALEPAESLIRRETIEQLVSMLPAGRHPPFRRIVRRYWVDDWTFREIGIELGLGECRVSQLHTQAMKLLRHAARERWPGGLAEARSS